MPSNVRIEFEAAEGEQKIISHLASVPGEHATQADLSGAEQAAIDSLFIKLGRDLVVSEWKLLLFVLPQGGKKLHHFPSEGPRTVERLREYVDPKKIRTDIDGLERSFLDMEAHIVKDAGESSTMSEALLRTSANAVSWTTNRFQSRS